MKPQYQQYNKMTIDQINAQYGKIPPQDIEVEEAVLGALMLERDAYITVSDIIDTASFYKQEHQQIFEVIKHLSKKGKPIDLLMVTKELKNRNLLDDVGGPMTITKLTSKVSSAAHIEHHSRIIAQMFISRELIRITAERGAQAYDQSVDVDETLSGLQNDLILLSENGIKTESSFSDGSRELKQRIERNLRNTGLSGIGTGLFKLDQFTGGLQKTDLVIIAGESSQGKTSLALTILKNAAMKYKARAAVFSLEMSKVQLTARLIAQDTNISAKTILNKALLTNERTLINKSIDIMDQLPIYFDESSSSTIDKICSSIRRLKFKKGIEIAVVDYLQLVSTSTKNQTDESKIAEISRRLKNVAKELDITVIALSQLSRDRQHPKPSKSRLRGSGQIEEAADIVLLIWRPEEYEIKSFDEPFKGTPTDGLAEAIIAKGRNIGTGSFLLKFNPETTGFYDYDSRFQSDLSWVNPNERIEKDNIF